MKDIYEETSEEENINLHGLLVFRTVEQANTPFLERENVLFFRFSL